MLKKFTLFSAQILLL